MLTPLQIGPLRIDWPVLLAPMAGYTDAVMRALARRFHAGMGYTEVASAEGLLRGAPSSWHLLDTAPDEAPVAAHLYGADPDRLAEAAARIERLNRFQAIDLNCGCPVPKIMARGAGAALVSRPDTVGRIVRAMSRAVALPVTVKTRLGPAPGRPTVLELAQAVAENGGRALAVHARYVSGRHTGPTDWPLLARVKASCRIPVIGNGGIATPDDAFRMVGETGVDGVMIGKAAIGNPWLFEAVWAGGTGRPWTPHAPAEHRAVIAEHLDALIRHTARHARASGRSGRKRYTPEEAAVLHFRAYLVGYARGFPNSATLRRGLQAMRTPADVLAAVDALLA